MSNPLYLEQRISIVRRALNEQSLQFQEKLPKDLQEAFHQYVLNMIAVLGGDPFGDATKQLEWMK